MASAKRVEKVEQVQDAQLRDTLMSEKIEALLNSTTDSDLRQVLEGRLQAMQKDGNMDIEDAIDEIQSLGLDPVSILQKGLSKDVNSRAYAAIKAQENAEESA
jgi:hypothetical protein